jgi:hypothetical protein
MKKEKFIRIASICFICFSAFCLLSVSIMAFFSPQSVMELVGVKLENTDAFSSIRGVYGGVGMTLVISLIYLLRKNIKQALGFLALLWGFYALSRAITIFAEGPLGEFGTQWIVTETVLFCLALLLLFLNKNKAVAAQKVFA